MKCCPLGAQLNVFLRKLCAYVADYTDNFIIRQRAFGFLEN
jgi:hypothetical protein